MASAPEERNPSHSGWLRRFTVGGGIVLLLAAGAGYAWTFTPSYSLYRIRQALETHDYILFTRYVDVDSVLDHGLDEVVGNEEKNAEGREPHGPLAKALRKGLLKNFARDARAVVKAGLDIAVEQAVKNRESQLPEIPASAVVVALWAGRAAGDTRSYPIKFKGGKQSEVKARQTPEGLWRVVEVENLPALLPALKSRSAPEHAKHSEEQKKEKNDEPDEP
jgi:hypothetical protein